MHACLTRTRVTCPRGTLARHLTSKQPPSTGKAHTIQREAQAIQREIGVVGLKVCPHFLWADSRGLGVNDLIN
ncbi:hypothetical protein AMTR_s00068p00117860 [Amborella trichopoda]|uniref:Uncharacterized protein n=1 Tax=Amborella trichopoda TaxID=13333 RepID=U5DD21_AMBTC|nr:hypothetical protein AMTR_s00068p00117860 [Amborella trichopoda]